MSGYETGYCAECLHKDILADGKLCVSCWCRERDRQEGRVHHYFITIDGKRREVTEDEWVDYERAAGFWNTMGFPERPATGGFIGQSGSKEIKGDIETEIKHA